MQLYLFPDLRNSPTERYEDSNHQIEVIDVWHFIISLALENYAQNLKGGVEELSLHISQLESFSSVETSTTAFASQDEVIAKVENLIRLSIATEALELDKLLSEFFDLVLMSGLNLETLYRLYVGKNILNQFRQDHGYKDGSYIKIWNGEEDNVVMKRIWETNGDIKPDVLYEELQKAYKLLDEK